ncbi:MAG: YihA family ribosome biogenesis GTP-binding protein [Acidobacteria bacterium]|nr:YihA family ribosome biogenesis GTP-binding protein [Acidobacteriota bacterium]
MVQAEFVISAFSEREFPREGIPEVVFAGRSNVGKSSLINRLAGHGKLARTSSTPGKTQSINYYRLNRTFFFVDLPGFGYAKAGKFAVRKWKDLIERYFHKQSTIALVIQLVDSRMPPTGTDIQLSEWLDELQLPRIVVATKSDKLSNNQKSLQSRLLTRSMGGRSCVMSSAKTGEGCREIWKQVQQATSITVASKT